MRLKELIARLERMDQNAIVAHGLNVPMSHRADYLDLAFDLRSDPRPVSKSLEAARYALGSTFEGYKGGEYLMEGWTTVYLARYGDCGPELDDLWFDAVFRLNLPHIRRFVDERYEDVQEYVRGEDVDTLLKEGGQ